MNTCGQYKRMDSTTVTLSRSYAQVWNIVSSPVKACGALPTTSPRPHRLAHETLSGTTNPLRRALLSSSPAKKRPSNGNSNGGSTNLNLNFSFLGPQFCSEGYRLPKHFCLRSFSFL